MRAALILLLAVVSCSGLRASSQIERDVVYTPAGWPQALAADLYLPSGRGPHPAVVVIHGGGWERRTRADMESIAERLAARGFVAMNVSYRFAPAHRFPAQVHDLQHAVRWLRAAAPRYNIDPKRIGAFGYSAGAHLAAMLGTISDGDELDRPHGGADTRLQAVVAGGTPSDLRKFTGGRLVPQFLGAKLQEKPELFALASPVVHVSRGDAPMFIYHGGGDTLVDLSHAEDLKRALDDAKVRAELRVVPVIGHVLTFMLARGTEDEAIEFLWQVLARE
jgi:acetyl esterase/lipase